MSDLEVVPYTVDEAEEYLKKHDRHYVMPAKRLCAMGLKGAGGMHGAVILGMREDRDAELAHIYSDGISLGYTLLYGSAWRALKAMGFKKTAL